MSTPVDDNLQRLQAHARDLFIAEAYRERVPDGLDVFTRRISREVSLRPLDAVVKHGMEMFLSLSRQRRNESDVWFAPRIHAALRLFRREAADAGVWHYLTLVRYRDYVLWRWADGNGLVTEERVLGNDRRNALAHLWWAAELSRNGPDYGPVEKACQMQEALVTLTEILASSNRAAAQAFIHFVMPEGGAPRSASDIKVIRRALNHSLSTYALDAAAPDPGPAADAIERWVAEVPDIGHITAAGPVIGPDDPPVPEAAVAEVSRQLRSLAKQMGLPA
jgi:hypothetical protein